MINYINDLVKFKDRVFHLIVVLRGRSGTLSVKLDDVTFRVSLHLVLPFFIHFVRLRILRNGKGWKY